MEVPDAFRDPLLLEVMRDPVVTPSGHTYERACIEEWIEGHGTCPMTRAPLRAADLVPNRDMGEAIQQFLAANDAVQERIDGIEKARRELQRRVDATPAAPQSPLARFTCPMDGSVLRNPVRAEDGSVYERRNISRWIAEHMRDGAALVSPITREPMGDALAPDPALRQEIERFAAKLHSAPAAEGDAAADAFEFDSTPFESIGALNRIFLTMDRTSDVLQEVLAGWQPPRVVIVGNQSEGKSTILERLCMMPLFPRSKAICTRVPVKIDVRRGEPRPPTLEIWDTKKGAQVGRTRTIPLASGDVDIRAAMGEVMAAQQGAVSADHELRIRIVSPTLPPMNLVDLPGLVDYPEDLRERTHGLVRQYMAEHREESVYIVVTRADSSPRKCAAMRHVEALGVTNRTVGCLTFCDRLDADEDFELVRGWLSNSPHAPDAVPLEPHGYVATMNKELRARGGESNLSRLVRQAESEPGWFDGEGLGAERAGGRATAQALLDRVGKMYRDHVLRTFVPKTIGRLVQELLQCERQREGLGLPESPGDVAAGSELLVALRRGAADRARTLLCGLFDRAVAEYMAGPLAELQRALDEAIPTSSSTVAVQEVGALLTGMVRRASAASAGPSTTHADNTKWPTTTTTTFRSSSTWASRCRTSSRR
eukprot:TRINITY_DN8154_c0_g1_i2.p1 TRINITY_DN8154_c0_g1~~TRINITY_DN8154_c0_g1_i2.p1  ORF type:complete len:654 (+),score=148.12 TRINITY_DN8154_c0_g1_i2:48-2009(+)